MMVDMTEDQHEAMLKRTASLKLVIAQYEESLELYKKLAPIGIGFDHVQVVVRLKADQKVAEQACNAAFKEVEAFVAPSEWAA
jgi:hypothetical protein